ncbi:MAG: AMP-binding protein [Clostridia bacterium]|nr:AMP-binding protein [Clostridia bacterium]
MADILKITPLEPWIDEKTAFISGSRLTENALRQYQETAFWANFFRAKRLSPFYKKLYTDIDLTACNGFTNIEKLPLINEHDLRKFDKQMLCVGQDEIHRIVTLASSGTTGEAKRVYFTESDQELTVDFFANGMQTFTKYGDKVLILLPSATPGCVGDLLATALRRFGACPLPYGIVDGCEKLLSFMSAEQPQVVVANPVQMLLLAYYYKSKLEKSAVKINLNAILLSTDYVAASLVKKLESIFNCLVYEHYGMTEMGLGGGVSCKAGEGYHLREADMLFEVVNPQTGKNVSVGEYGEIVFTTLTRKAMPFIRYATGDRGRFLPGPCACGTVLRRLDKVKGRLNDPVDIGTLDEIIFAYDGVVDYSGSFDGENLKLVLNIFDEIFKVDLSKITANLPYKAELKAEYGIKPFMNRLVKRQIKSKECLQ